MKVADIMKTERMLLRPPRVTDARAIFDSYASDPEVTRFLTWKPHASAAETRTWLRGCLARRRSGKILPWVITLEGSDHPIGMIEVRLEGHRADLGYVLARSYWGRGLMTEALRAVTDELLAVPDVHRAWALCDVENLASARVLEKAGLQREGVLRKHLAHPGAEPRDAACYARIR